MKSVEQFFNVFGSTENKPEQFFCPGRINIMGEHIDYNGGLVLPSAISLGITAWVRKRNDNCVNVYSTKYNRKVTFHMDESLHSLSGEDAWANYVVGVFHIAKQQGYELCGYDMLVESNLPSSSGLSSSASITVLMLYILLHDKINSREKIALLAQRVEHEFIGVQCGIMDQYAVACGKSNSAMLLDCKKLTAEYFHIDFRNYKLIIINSNRPRNLAESVYNTRKSECDEAFAILKNKVNITCLADVRAVDVEHFLQDEVLKKRALHVATEQLRTRNSAVALRNKDVFTLGEFFNESHKSLRERYEVSSAELNTIVDTATRFDSCAGARLTGAGFGGCCIALIQENEIEKVCNAIFENYKKLHAIEAEFYDFHSVHGVHKMA